MCAAVSAACTTGPAIVYLIVETGTCSSQERCELTGVIEAATPSAFAVASAPADHNRMPAAEEYRIVDSDPALDVIDAADGTSDGVQEYALGLEHDIGGQVVERHRLDEVG